MLANILYKQGPRLFSRCHFKFKVAREKGKNFEATQRIGQT